MNDKVDNKILRHNHNPKSVVYYFNVCIKHKGYLYNYINNDIVINSNTRSINASKTVSHKTTVVNTFVLYIAIITYTK